MIFKSNEMKEKKKRVAATERKQSNKQRNKILFIQKNDLEFEIFIIKIISTCFCKIEKNVKIYII